MIEITHAQARRLLREKIDGRPISDEQWAILQAHLEACPDCRADQERLAGLERGLAHTLHLRWSGLHPPQKKPVEAVTETIFTVRRERARRRKLTRYALQALLVLLALAGYTRYRQVTAPPPPTPTPAVQPISGAGTPQTPHLFRGVVAVESAQGGRPQVALLNPGPDAAADVSWLVDEAAPGSTAASSQPAWSPDGQWVAFLSDRTGKNEVYVIHVSGARLTQLSDDPLVTWQGPLTWSADGQWIALIGVSGGAIARSNVFLVPINGAGARTLGFTRDTPGPVAFSPAAPMLAFGAADYGGSLLVFNLTRAQYFGPTQQDTLTRQLRFSPSGGLSWSPDGDWLAYVVEGREPAKDGQAFPGAWISQLKISYNYIQSARDGSTQNTNRTVLTYEGENGFRGLAWSPDTQRRLLAFLRQDPADTCLTVHLIQAQGSGDTPLKLGGLCVEGGLSQASWTADGQWLVVLGHRPGEAARGYFALRVPKNLKGPGVAQFERLADAPELGQEGASIPQVRSVGKLLDLQPKAVGPAGGVATPAAEPEPMPAAPRETTQPAATQEPAARPSYLLGKVAYLPLGQQAENALVTMLPNGQVFQELKEDGFVYSCPAFAPDGNRIAFLRAPADQPARTDIWVKGTIGADLVRVSPEEGVGMVPGGREPAQARFGCPAWSPDGTRLATLEITPGGKYRLVVLDPATEDPRAVAYVPYPSFFTRPVWSPDGQSVYLVNPTSELHPARILRDDLGRGYEPLFMFIQSTGWNDVFGMAFSPDGSRFAYLSAQYARDQVRFQLHITEAQSGDEIRVFDLPAVQTGTWFGSQALDWLPDGRLGFLYRHRVDAQVKTELYRVDPEQGELKPFAQLDEVVYDLAWSPDGAWVIYTGENGIYALGTSGDRPSPPPVLLLEQRASEVDWR